eukprot:5153-Prorocentrum_minimum.AAC.3
MGPVVTLWACDYMVPLPVSSHPYLSEESSMRRTSLACGGGGRGEGATGRAGAEGAAGEGAGGEDGRTAGGGGAGAQAIPTADRRGGQRHQPVHRGRLL